MSTPESEYPMSNEGDVVYDPFGGLMTTVSRAIALKRFGVAAELNPMYFLDGAAYCQAAAKMLDSLTLFDLIERTPEEMEMSA